MRDTLGTVLLVLKAVTFAAVALTNLTNAVKRAILLLSSSQRTGRHLASDGGATDKEDHDGGQVQHHDD